MKKMVRRGLHLFIIAAITAIFGALTAVGASAVTFDTAPYTYEGESGVTITGFNGVSEGQTVTIPAEIDGQPVLALGLDGAMECIPGAGNIGTLDLSEAKYLKIIENTAFWFCSNINGTIQSDTVEKIEDNAFQGCNIEILDLPVCTTIGSYAFYYCTSLKEVSLPECKSVALLAFADCQNLTDVVLAECESIGDNAFYYCQNLSFVILKEDCNIGTDAFNGTPDTLEIESMEPSETVEPSETASYTFQTAPYTYYDLKKEYDMTGTKGVVITGFNNVSPGETVTIPAEIDGQPVLAIGTQNASSWECMPGAENIGILNLENASNLKQILSYAFYGCQLTGTIESDTVEVIGAYTFDSCTNLKEVRFPACYTVAVSAFSRCTNITDVYLPECESVGYAAFKYCQSLNFVTLKPGCYIETEAFSDTPDTLKIDA